MGGYELHQKLRTKAVRLLKKKDYDRAIDELHAGAKELLAQKEQGSGCDLGLYMIEVYGLAEVGTSKVSRARIVDLVTLAAPDFWRKKLIDAAIKWSSTITGLPNGDGHLRSALAAILDQQGDHYAAEAHHIAACAPPPPGSASFQRVANERGLDVKELFPQGDAAAKAFAQSTWAWLRAFAKAEDKAGGRKADVVQRAEAGRFALRGLMPLLAGRAITSARAYLSSLIKDLTAAHTSLLLPVKPNPKAFSPPQNSVPAGLQGSVSTFESTSQPLYLTGNAELNFSQMALGLCLLAVDIKRRGGAGTNGRINDALRGAWVNLVRQYERESAPAHAASAAGDEDLAVLVGEGFPLISAAYFDMQPPRQQGNMLQDMLGSLMGGGGAGGGGSGAAKRDDVPLPKRAPAPRAFEGGAGTGAGGAAGLGEDAAGTKADDATAAGAGKGGAKDEADEEELDLD